jgi:2,3-bisphosphoglycerate-independent phosphoglycerate mutase
VEYVNCACGEGFWREAHETWKRKCISCWRQSKPPTARAAPNTLQIIQELKERIQELEEMLEYQEEQTERLRGLYLAEYNSKRATVFDIDTLKQIRRLVHPDKHDNSPAATQVAQKVNELIRRMGVG